MNITYVYIMYICVYVYVCMYIRPYSMCRAYDFAPLHRTPPYIISYTHIYNFATCVPDAFIWLSTFNHHCMWCMCLSVSMCSTYVHMYVVDCVHVW